MQLERDIGKANIASDCAFFDRVEADEFIFTDAGGGVTTKKQDLEGPSNRAYRTLSWSPMTWTR